MKKQIHKQKHSTHKQGEAMLKKMLPLIVFGLLFTAQTFAQSIAIGPQVGYLKSKEADKGALMFGGAARLNFASLSVEAAINYRKEEMEFGGDLTSYPVLLTGMLHVLPIAYGLAGIGWYNYKYEVSGFEHKGSDFGYHVGGGAEISLGSVILTADIRYVFLEYQFDNGLGGTFDVESNFYIITGGVLFPL